MPPRKFQWILLSSPRAVLIPIFAALYLLIFAGSAVAAGSFPDACGGANNFDPAVCERVDYLTQRADDTEKLTGWLVGGILFLGSSSFIRGILSRNG